MFDTYVTKQAPNYPQTVIEKRAPTDESVKLLSEMEKAARDRVLAVYRTKDTVVDAVIVEMRRDPEHAGRCYHFAFTLNGREIRFKKTVDERDLADMARSRHALGGYLYQAIAHEVTRVVMGDMVKVWNR